MGRDRKCGGFNYTIMVEGVLLGSPSHYITCTFL